MKWRAVHEHSDPTTWRSPPRCTARFHASLLSAPCTHSALNPPSGRCSP